MSIFIGVGGWVYPEWRDNFYPFAAAGCKPDKSILRIDLSRERAEHERGAMT